MHPVGLSYFHLERICELKSISSYDFYSNIRIRNYLCVCVIMCEMKHHIRLLCFSYALFIVSFLKLDLALFTFLGKYIL